MRFLAVALSRESNHSLSPMSRLESRILSNRPTGFFATGFADAASANGSKSTKSQPPVNPTTILTIFPKARQVHRRRESANAPNSLNNSLRSTGSEIRNQVHSCLCFNSRRCSFNTHRRDGCSVVFTASAHNMPLQRTPIYWNTACVRNPSSNCGFAAPPGAPYGGR